VTLPAATDLSVDIRIADPRWEAALGDIDALAARALGCAASRMATGGEVSILLTADPEMRELNRQWRGFDKPTDVLSFPSDGPVIPGEPKHLGDIAIAYETAMRDAETMQRPADAHACHLLVHGFLHLLGYDHIESADAAVMEPLETQILADLGWPDPYSTGPYTADRHGDPD
jgi:probable rRNA maturation factor